MELLESVGPRPRQARYQAALRPDMNCFIHSKALSNFTSSPRHHFKLGCAKTVSGSSIELRCLRIQRHCVNLPLP
jgi:hypothetical protein